MSNPDWNTLPVADSTASDAAQEEYARAFSIIDHDEQMHCPCGREIRPEWTGVGVRSGQWLCGSCLA